MKVEPLSLAVLPVITLWRLCAAGPERRSGSAQEEPSPTASNKFPEYFTFGVSSTAYQTEGVWNITGKSDSIWDVYSHQSGKIRNNDTGDDSCKSYEYYERDREMLSYLKVNFYRLSISWPRILPNGFANQVSKLGVDHYNKILDDLLAHLIDPIVVMYNSDLPQALQDLGGWTNPEIVVWVTEYARTLFKNFGGKVKNWITFNKPRQIGMGYSSDEFAPGVKAHGIGEYRVAKHVVLAHASIWHMYKNEFGHDQKGFVGIGLDVNFYQGRTEAHEDIEAASDAMEFEVGLYAHPIFSKAGGFPRRLEDLVAAKSYDQGYPESRLIPFTPADVDFCKGASDFFGFNHFTTSTVTRKGYVPGKVPSMEDDLGVNISSIAVNPYGIRQALNWVRDSYGNPPIMILENGVATNGHLQDSERIDYLEKYLSNVLDAIKKDRVGVTGYAVWSLMDSFEWKAGYDAKYGLFSVDFDDVERRRTARLSAIWYKNLLETKTLDPDFEPKFENMTF